MTLAHGTDWIESGRLIFRRIVQSDFELFARIHSDPVVARYLGNGRPRSIQETRALLESFCETYKSLELGPLAVLRKSDGVLIGRCGLSEMALEVNVGSGKLPRVWYQRSQVPLDNNVIFEQELGYSFDRHYWGQGYASEGAARVFEYASSTMPFRRIVSVIHPDNTPSIKVAKKCGARQENNVMLLGQEFFRFKWPETSHHL
ncbi:MAG TPA: GNAT family N-acetyltransferase [Verrucomicrobiae bacterium]|nr:GNAT family N-acetyltransferase [Verrucomicrobiae bacterium]